MFLTYKKSNSATEEFNLGRVNLLKFKDKAKVNEFCSAIEKAISSDSLKSCDDWDLRNLDVTDTCRIPSAVLETEAGKYGYSDKETHMGMKLIHGVRYLSGDNYSSFVSALMESAEDADLVSAEAFLAAYDSEDFYENPLGIVTQEALNNWSEGVSDVKSFLSDLISEVTYTVNGVVKVVLLPKPSILSDENYISFVMFLIAHSNIDLCVLTDSDDLRRELLKNGIQYSIIE